MRVVLNGLTALKPRTGIGQYCAQLAAGMTSSDLIIYPPHPWPALASRVLKSPDGPPTSPTQASWRSALKNLGRSLSHLHFASFCRRHRVQLYHEPNYIPFTVDVPTVITIHDLSVLLHPEWHPADRVRVHGKKLEQAARNAAHIITDTEQVRREVLAELGIHPSKVTAIHLGVSDQFRPVPVEELRYWRTKLNLPDRYFLCIGTIEPRKNLLLVMRAYAALPLHLRRDFPLLLVGPWGWRAHAEFEFFEQQGRSLGMRHLGYIPDAARPALYTSAWATLYPSRYEGFGLPPLESLACGTPVICSRGVGAVQEVVGNAANYCDPDDVDAWRAAMELAMDQPRAGFRMTKAYTWQATIAATRGIYEQVLATTASRRAA